MSWIMPLCRWPLSVIGKKAAEANVPPDRNTGYDPVAVTDNLCCYQMCGDKVLTMVVLCKKDCR